MFGVFTVTADRVAAWLGVARPAGHRDRPAEAEAGLRFCISSRTAGHCPLAETLDLAARLHFAGVEVWSVDLERTGELPHQLRRQARSLDLTLICHARTRRANIAAPLAGHRRRALATVRSSLRDAAELGAGLCVVHPGKMKSPQHDPEESWPILVESMALLSEEATGLGVTIGVEQMEPGRAFFCNPDDIRRLFSAVPSEHLRLTLDLNHAAKWCLATGTELAAFVREAERVAHVHLSDSGGKARHLPLGEGVLDIPGMLDALRCRDYRGTVTIEGRAEGRELAAIEANRRYLRYRES